MARVVTFYEIQVKPMKVVIRLGSQSARGSRYVFSESEVYTDSTEREDWIKDVPATLSVAAPA